MLWPQRSRKWFWPDDRKAGRYRSVAWVNAALVASFAVLNSMTSGPWLLAGAVLLAVVGIVASFAIVGMPDATRSPHSGWRVHFWLARTSFLVVAATVPAIACFQIACNFEVELLTRRAQGRLSAAIDARTARAERDARKVRCSGSDGCTQLEDFLARRLGNVSWDLHLPPPPRAESGVSPQFEGALGSVLTSLQPLYNEVAAEFIDTPSVARVPDWRWYSALPDHEVLASVNRVLSADAPRFRPGMSWLIAGVVGGLVFMLMRFAVRPLFLLDLCDPPGLRSAGRGDPGKNVLIVGPPGSGKSALFGAAGVDRILDVRSLAWVRGGTPVPLASVPSGWSINGMAIDAMDRSLLPDGGVLGIDHVEYRLDEAGVRDQLLSFLEKLLYRRNYRVWIAAARDPIELWRENGAALDLDAWRRLLQSFRKVTVGLNDVAPDPDCLAGSFTRTPGTPPSPLERHVLDECSASPSLLAMAPAVISGLPSPLPAWEDLRYEIGVAAEPYYQSLWAACSKDDRVALRQLAEEGVVNPRNHAVVAHLLRSGLIRRDPTFRVMNETFREFVLRELPAADLTAWEHEGVRLPWGSITTTMLTLALGLIGAILLTQQQLVDTWVGSYMPTLVPALPVLWRVFTVAQVNPKGAAGTRA